MLIKKDIKKNGNKFKLFVIYIFLNPYIIQSIKDKYKQLYIIPIKHAVWMIKSTILQT